MGRAPSFGKGFGTGFDIEEIPTPPPAKPPEIPPGAIRLPPELHPYRVEFTLTGKVANRYEISFLLKGIVANRFEKQFTLKGQVIPTLRFNELLFYVAALESVEDDEEDFDLALIYLAASLLLENQERCDVED